MDDNVIEVRGLRKHYGAVRAVDGVDLLVRRGSILGLIGRNGAGKSTLFRMMLGLTPPTSGEVLVAGQPVHGLAFRELRRSIGYLPENAVFYDNLTGLETLRFFASLKSVDRAECAPLLQKVGLGSASAQRVGGYSKGMRQRLGLAQALLGRPNLLFLDEPTNGLDPEGVREFYGILDELRRAGGTVLLTSHVLAEIQDRVDRLAILQLGRLQATGTLPELRAAMGLPLTLSVTPREGAAGRIERALAELGLHGARFEQGAFSVSCQRERKIAALAALAALDGAVADLQVREPTLEDVFLGYAG